MKQPGISPLGIQALFWCFVFLLLPNKGLSIQNNAPLLLANGNAVEAQKAALSIRTIGAQTHFELQLSYRLRPADQVQFFFPLPEKAIPSSATCASHDSSAHSVFIGTTRLPDHIRFPSEALRFGGQRLLHGRFKVDESGQLALTIAWRQALAYHAGDFSLSTPLDFVGHPDTLQLSIRFSQQRFAPLVRSAPASLNFRRFQGDFIAEQTFLHQPAPSPLKIQLPTQTDDLRSWVGSGKDTIPFVVQTVFPTSNSWKKPPRSLDILWDCSFAGRHRNLSRELALLENYLSQMDGLKVTVYRLAHLFLAPLEFEVVDGDASALLSYLSEVVYDGFTTQQEVWPQLRGEEALLFPGANQRMLEHPFKERSRSVYCIQSSPLLESSTFPLPSSTSLIDLNSTSQRGAIDQLRREHIRLEVVAAPHLFELQVHTEKGETEVFMISGKTLRDQPNLDLEFKAANRTMGKQAVVLPIAPGPDHMTTSCINAGVFAMASFSRLGQLDTLQAPLPPQGLPAPEDLAYRQGLLQETWTDLSEWYDGEAPPSYATGEPGGSWPIPAQPASPVFQNGFHCMVMPNLILQGRQLKPLNPKRASGDVVWMRHPRQEILWGTSAANGFWVKSQDNLEQVRRMLNQPPGWEQSAAYLDTLARANGRAWQVYPTLRSQWHASPSFFIDAADHFIRLGEVDHAEIVLSNLLAPGHNAPEVLRATAHRLQALGRDDLALLFFHRVYSARPGIPPVVRDLALSLAEQGQWQAALERLLEALYSPPEMFRQQSPGLRNILLTELNHLLAASEVPLDRSQIPARWVRPLPLDLRIVIDWNRSDTDVDLWVTDPAGQKCHFDLPFTQMGGKLAGDVTDGFGPEAFALKNAQPGKYLIEVEYDDDPELKLSGPSFVKVTIFTDYGRATEQKQVIPLRLENSSDQVQVATVEIR